MRPSLLTLLLLGCSGPDTGDSYTGRVDTDADDTDTGDVDTDSDDTGRPEDWPGGRYAVEFDNALDESITGVLVLPDGVDRVPVAVVLHGSGGLFEDVGTFAGFDPSSARLERPFREWEALLSAKGAAVFFPASFASRGSFDWNDDPIDGWDKPERLSRRTLDATAAWDHVCAHPRIDCGRSAVLGFSNGGSTTLLGTSRELASSADFPGVQPMTPGVAIAWYPGCGLHGLVPLTSGTFTPTAPVVLTHGDQDDLLDNCLDRIDQARSSGATVDHHVFEDVGHSFDATPDTAAEEEARSVMRARALEILDGVFSP